MKKIVLITGIVIGSCMIGYFANQLSSTFGSVLFSLGMVLAVCSIAAITKEK